MNNVQSQYSPTLEIRSVGELTEKFLIPDYQRGYRWERTQVKKLLDDIKDSDSKMPYYLQPIVVAPNDEGGYNLIDGQQRLTTLFLINQYLTYIKASMEGQEFNPLNSIDTTPRYTLSYQTRKDSEDFLQKIMYKNLEDAQITPDFLYMWHAYEEIKDWFHQNSHKIGDIANMIKTNVKIIWYELNYNVNSWEKFSDLNIGKIPLTNSELVKALFMRDNPAYDLGITEQEKVVIVDQWDSVERELHDPLLWGFLTNDKQKKYDTLIDLLFDIIAKKRSNENDDFFTFLYFEKKMGEEKVKNGKSIWDNIYLQYQRLRDWYDDRHLYHKIGYLVVQDRKGDILSDIFEKTKNKGHNELNLEIDDQIRKSIDLTTKEGESRRLNELRYGNDNAMIERILTLFNVLTMDQINDSTQRYSFYHHKNVNGGWSLEHIHAQHSEGLNTVSKWRTWVELHRKSLMRYRDQIKIKSAPSQKVFDEITNLASSMDSFLQQKEESCTFVEFTRIFERFFEITETNQTSSDSKDEMANMALLGKDDNSMLNNAVFDVKRELILKAMSGSYIPICTQRVFLKVYAPAEDNQLFFWGDLDRLEYIDAMERTLKPYLYTGYVTEKELQNKQESSKDNIMKGEEK